MRKKLPPPAFLDHPDFHAFARAIHDDPHDLMIRGAFSDWLEERGHKREAAAIRYHLDPTGENGIDPDIHVKTHAASELAPPKFAIYHGGVMIQPPKATRLVHLAIPHRHLEDLIGGYHFHKTHEPRSAAEAASGGYGPRREKAEKALWQIHHFLETFAHTKEDLRHADKLRSLLTRGGRFTTDSLRTANRPWDAVVDSGAGRFSIDHFHGRLDGRRQKPGAPVRLNRTPKQ